MALVYNKGIVFNNPVLAAYFLPTSDSVASQPKSEAVLEYESRIHSLGLSFHYPLTAKTILSRNINLCDEVNRNSCLSVWQYCIGK